MTACTPSRDIPKLEVYPWAFVGGLTLMWVLLWFFLWTSLQGMTASLAVAFGSLHDFRFLPRVIPGLLALGLGGAGWIAHRLRHGQNPPLPALALTLLLLTAFAPGAFYMVTLLNRMTPYELTRNFTSVFFQVLLGDGVLDQLALFLCVVLGGGATRLALHGKYPGIRPSLKYWIPVVWLLAMSGGLPIGFRWGTIFGILFATGLGNYFTVYAYRKTIADCLKTEGTHG